MNKIPKIVHYIWVGSDIPLNIEAQIKKNSQFLEGYTIKIWTESNMPVLNDFAKQAYADKKWAFVSDYLRFYILYHEGGIYLDTDMDLLKPLDDLLENSFVSGWNRQGREVYAGIIGTEKEDMYIKAILDVYETIPSGEYPTSPEVMTQCYYQYENKERLTILESSYFYPLLDGERATTKRLAKAYTNHLWHESWRTYVPLRRFLRRIGLMKLYHFFLFRMKK
jgi:mannosyltransferase OCH1-like enzyme